MHSSKIALDQSEWNARTAGEHVRDVARWFRGRGLKSGHAIQRAADCLAISYDLAWRLHYQAKIWSLPSARLRQIERAYAASIDLEVAELEARIARLRIKQTELRVGQCSCGDGFVISAQSTLCVACAGP